MFLSVFGSSLPIIKGTPLIIGFVLPQRRLKPNVASLIPTNAIFFNFLIKSKALFLFSSEPPSANIK